MSANSVICSQASGSNISETSATRRAYGRRVSQTFGEGGDRVEGGPQRVEVDGVRELVGPFVLLAGQSGQCSTPLGGRLEQFGPPVRRIRCVSGQAAVD